MMSNQGTTVLFSALIAACSGLLFGFDTGIIADTQWQLSRQFLFTHWQWSLIVSSMVLGAFVGAISSGCITEHYGRRSVLKVTAVLFVIVTLITANTHHFISLFSGLFLLGISIGISAYCAPLFIAEIAEYQKRGQMVLLNNVAITGGEALAFLTGYLLQDISDNSWRWMFLLGILPAMFLWCGLQYVPESPRWLIKHKREKEALKILKKIRGSTSDAVLREFQSIKRSLPSKASENLFAKPYRKQVGIGTTLGILQQTCGIKVIMYYGPFLFKHSGFNESQALFATFIMGALNTLCTVFAMLMVDQWGRKNLLMLGLMVCACALFGLASFDPQTGWNPWLSFASLFIYTMAFAIGLGSMFWLLISELYPLAIRAKAMSFTSSIQWLANFSVSLSFLPLYDSIGRKATFLLLCFSCVISVLFSYFYVPETKGLQLEEIH